MLVKQNSISIKRVHTVANEVSDHLKNSAVAWLFVVPLYTTDNILWCTDKFIKIIWFFDKYTGWPPKSKPLPNYQKLCSIVSKSVNEIRFLRQIKEMIKHYNIICRY